MDRQTKKEIMRLSANDATVIVSLSCLARLLFPIASIPFFFSPHEPFVAFPLYSGFGIGVLIPSSIALVTVLATYPRGGNTKAIAANGTRFDSVRLCFSSTFCTNGTCRTAICFFPRWQRKEHGFANGACGSNFFDSVSRGRALTRTVHSVTRSVKHLAACLAGYVNPRVSFFCKELVFTLYGAILSATRPPRLLRVDFPAPMARNGNAIREVDFLPLDPATNTAKVIRFYPMGVSFDGSTTMGTKNSNLSHFASPVMQS